MSKITDEPTPPDHVHTSACRQLQLVCRVTEHEHSGACHGRHDDRVTCGRAVHGHGAACYVTGYRCGFD